MAQQTINTGTGNNTGDGEGLRPAFIKINDNFNELYNRVLNYVILVDDYLIADNDYNVQITVSGKTITLPDATSNTGKTYIIDNSSDGNVTVDTTFSQIITGLDINGTSFVLATQNVLEVTSNGTLYRFR